jgi:hypothetical protein
MPYRKRGNGSTVLAALIRNLGTRRMRVLSFSRRPPYYRGFSLHPPKPSNRNLGGPHTKVENFHFKFIPIGCSPHLKEYWKNILRLRTVICLTENSVKIHNEKSHDSYSLPNIRLIRKDEMDGVCGTHEEQKLTQSMGGKICKT